MKVAVVGAGRMGQLHLSALNKIRAEDNHVSEIGVFDILSDKAREAADKYSAVHLPSLDDVFSFKPDLTIIATPSASHYELASKLIDLSSLLVEKPVITKVEDGVALLNKSRETGHLVIPAHIERFNPLIEHLAKIEDLYHIDAKRLSRLNRDFSVYINVVFDLILHDIDAVIWATKPTTMTLRSINIEKEKFIVSSIVSLNIDNCITAVIHASWVSSVKMRQYNIIRNSGNSCTLDLLNNRTDCEGYEPKAIVDQLLMEDRNAIGAVRGTEKPRTTIEDAIRDQRVIDAVLRGGGFIAI
ncbi:MAG: Gfo/Idh/MocA family oxidoreductase [Thermocladium sp.]|jgi:predicted dehydrogenase